MNDVIDRHFQDLDLDIRKVEGSRFLDQKVTPDILSTISDGIIDYVSKDESLEFTVKDIWSSNYVRDNIIMFYSKPDTQNDSARNEYDKVFAQPLKTLAYAKVLHEKKRGNKNFYFVKNLELLKFISLKEKNSYEFLFKYITKVLYDSDFGDHLDTYIQKGRSNKLTIGDYHGLRDKFQELINTYTNIKKTYEPRRIFTKVINPIAVHYRIQGGEKGNLSDTPITYSQLMYNKINFRDVDKDKNIPRKDCESRIQTSKKYQEYLEKKAMSAVREFHNHVSEVQDDFSKGAATQVHHIFSRSDFPEISAHCENLICLTPNQHMLKAHPNNNTHRIDLDYQLVCLLAKSHTVENYLKHVSESLYSKNGYFDVVNTGLNQELSAKLSFSEIRTELVSIYHST